MTQEKPSITFMVFYDEVALGVRYLHSTLIREGFPAKIIFFQNQRKIGFGPTEDEISLLFDLIRDDDSDVFGLSFRSMILPLAKRVTGEIQRQKESLVLWGGTHPTLAPEDCMEFADIVCVGEGEGAVLDLMRAMDEGKDYSGIQNLWVKKGMEVSRNPIRPLIQDLDSLPWPTIDDQGKKAVMGEEVIHGDPKYNKRGLVTYFLAGSRGCPYACDYC
jgi:radical SAM superfamily enzyme YgiQ (UPF0313 family)